MPPAPIAAPAATSRRARGIVVVAIGLAALLWFLRALGIGFLSDDFGITQWLHRDSGAVDWTSVFADFARPWGAPTLYRPLVSVSFGLNLAFGSSPWGMHALNLLLVAVAAAATAATAALLLESRVAAVAAGFVVVLHPAMVEPAAWIASRTSGLELCFSTLACALFAARLCGRTPRRWPYALAAALALFSKEGALTLPLWLLALDLLHGGRRSWRQRAALHAPVLAVWAVHLLCRTLVLGRFSAGADPGRVQQRGAGLLQHLGELVTPPAPAMWWLLLPLAVLLFGLALGSPRRLGAIVLWLGAALLPTTLLRDEGPQFHGRYVCSAVPALAIACAFGVQALARWRSAQPSASAAALAGATRTGVGLGASALVLLLGGWGFGSAQWLRQYERAGAFVQQLQAQLWQAAPAAPGRPLGILALGDGGIPVSMLQQPLWPQLLRRPFAGEDRDAVALSGLLDHAVAAAGMFGDARPLRALLDAGATLVSWDGARGALHGTTAPAATEPVALVHGDDGSFAPKTPLDPLAVSAIEVQLPAKADACTLRLLGDLDGEIGFGARRLAAAGGSDRFVFDLTPALALLLRHGAGQPFLGCAIAVDGGVVPSRVRALPRPAALAVEALQGRELGVDDVGAVLRVEGGSGRMRCYLLPPQGPVAVDVATGQPLQPGEEAQWRLRYAARTCGPCRVYFFWQRLDPGPEGPQRSPLDWFTLR